MPNVRCFLSRRRLLAFLGVAAFVFGLLMLHPYPRQSLFGPTIRGKPWCVWEAEVRYFVHKDDDKDDDDDTLISKTMRWLSIKQKDMSEEEIFDHAKMLPLLLELADDRDWKVRQAAVSAFYWHESLQHPSVLAVLHRRLLDEDAFTRIRAAGAIWNINEDQSVIPTILRELEDKNPQVSSIFALSVAISMSNQTHEFLPYIAAHAKHPDADAGTRIVIMGLMHRYEKKGIPVLIQGLSDPHRDVRRQAARSLGDAGIDAKQGVPALTQCLNDVDPSVRAAAAKALLAIEGEPYQPLKVERKIE
jgi:hypothetical protein